MRGSKRFAWTIATPAILGLIAVSIVPIVWMAFSAFQKFSPNPKVAPKFNGLDNLWALFEDPQFVNSIGLTAFIGVILFVIQLTLGFAIAWALYHIRRGRSIVVSLILIPTAIAPLIAGLAWWMLFNTKFGAVNSILGIFGIDQVQWIVQMPWALVAIIVASVWHGTPFTAVILLGGLTTIPPDVLDAARVDGASPRRQLLYVVLPLMRPFFLVAGLFLIIGLVGLFEMPQAITQGGPGNETVVQGMYLFKLAFNFFDLGRSSMMSLLFVIFLSVVGTIFFRLMRRREV